MPRRCYPMGARFSGVFSVPVRTSGAICRIVIAVRMKGGEAAAGLGETASPCTSCPVFSTNSLKQERMRTGG
jgi:hypothetical protein